MKSILTVVLFVALCMGIYVRYTNMQYLLHMCTQGEDWACKQYKKDSWAFWQK